MGILRARILMWVAMTSSGDLPHPGIKFESLMSPASVAKNLPANAGDIADMDSVPGGRNGNSFQYSRLENPVNRGTWMDTVLES